MNHGSTLPSVGFECPCLGAPGFRVYGLGPTASWVLGVGFRVF